MARYVKLTPEGRERLRRRLDDEKERLAETSEFIRQQLLCNCDVDQASLRAARLKKQDLELHVDELEQALEHASLVVPPQEESVAGLGALVTLLQEETGERMEVQLVSDLDAGVAQEETMRISESSPVGRQLRGQREGDVFEVKTGAGRHVGYRVLDVRYPDARG